MFDAAQSYVDSFVQALGDGQFDRVATEMTQDVLIAFGANRFLPGNRENTTTFLRELTQQIRAAGTTCLHGRVTAITVPRNGRFRANVALTFVLPAPAKPITTHTEFGFSTAPDGALMLEMLAYSKSSLRDLMAHIRKAAPPA